MRAVVAVGIAVGLLAATSTRSAAQDEGDVAAWYAMAFTPYGALPPIASEAMAGVPRAGGEIARGFEIRYGQWAFDEEDDKFHSIGIGGRAGPIGFVLGYETCDGCDGIIMAGVDFESPRRTRPFGSATSTSMLSIGVRPALGVGIFTGEGSFHAISGTIDFPVSLSVPSENGSHFIPFLSPGFGVGRFSGDGESEMGIRPSLGAGIGFMAMNGLGIHLGWRKVFIEDGPSTLGVGLSVVR